MKLEVVNKNYQSQDERIRYQIRHWHNGINITIDQFQSGKICLDLKSAKILLIELELLIDEAEDEVGTERMDDSNENP